MSDAPVNPFDPDPAPAAEAEVVVIMERAFRTDDGHAVVRRGQEVDLGTPEGWQEIPLDSARAEIAQRQAEGVVALQVAMAEAQRHAEEGRARQQQALADLAAKLDVEPDTLATALGLPVPP